MAGAGSEVHGVSLQKYPPRKDFVRAVSLQTGYLIKANGTGACILYYLTQVDPRGECQRAPMHPESSTSVVLHHSGKWGQPREETGPF